MDLEKTKKIEKTLEKIKESLMTPEQKYVFRWNKAMEMLSERNSMNPIKTKKVLDAIKKMKIPDGPKTCISCKYNSFEGCTYSKICSVFEQNDSWRS